MLPLARRLHVDLSHDRVKRLGRSTPTLCLEPRPPHGCGGSVAHYYHFLFDLLLPISRLLGDDDRQATFLLRPFGPLTQALRDVLGADVDIRPPGDRSTTTAPTILLGMNPRCVRVTARDLAAFRRFVFGRLGVDEPPEPDTIVLIERMPPDDYFVQHAEQGGAGASRRSLRDHDHLRDWLAAAVRHPYRFLNLRLETMPLREQVEVFARCALVVGQHGAGLANLVWMPCGQNVLELNDASQKHFEILSRVRRNRFLRYQLPAPHAVVDVARFHDWIGRQSALRRFIT